MVAPGYYALVDDEDRNLVQVFVTADEISLHKAEVKQGDVRCWGCKDLYPQD